MSYPIGEASLIIIMLVSFAAGAMAAAAIILGRERSPSTPSDLLRRHEQRLLALIAELRTEWEVRVYEAAQLERRVQVSAPPRSWEEQWREAAKHTHSPGGT